METWKWDHILVSFHLSKLSFVGTDRSKTNYPDGGGGGGGGSCIDLSDYLPLESVSVSGRTAE